VFFSPEDVVAAAGRLAATDELRDQFGSKNAAAASFNNLINRQQQRLQDRFPDGARQFIESKDIFGRPLGTGKVTPAGANFMLRNFNEAAGFNPTRGMGIMDSLRSNYEQSGAKFNRNQAIRGIIGTLLGGPLGGIALGNFIPGGEESEEGMNEFGMPIYDGRQIDEYRTFGSAPAFDDALAFDPTNIAPMMRTNMPRSFTPRTLRNTPRITTPRITAGTAGVRFGQGSVPKANRFGTAGSPFQNQRMLNQPLSKYGQVGKGQPFQTRSLSSDIRNFFTKNPFGKRTPLGLGLGALGLLTGMTGNTGEATESSGSFMDNLGDVFDPSSEINQQPLFNFNPLNVGMNQFDEINELNENMEETNSPTGMNEDFRMPVINPELGATNMYPSGQSIEMLPGGGVIFNDPGLMAPNEAVIDPFSGQLVPNVNVNIPRTFDI
jgi:hypothetical protein